MNEDKSIHKDVQDIVLPALLRAARHTYGHAIRKALFEAGCSDMPKHGIYVLGGINRNGTKHGEIIRELRQSKQSTSQLIDTLALRGYINRSPDPEDRRRMNIELTERGMLAAEASRSAVEAVDKKLVEEVGEEAIATTKNTLAVLIHLGHNHEHPHDHGHHDHHHHHAE